MAVGIETDRGLWVASLVAAGYAVYAVNPLAVARYRERHVVSGAKSDPDDAAALADVVRTDRHHHRQIAGDSEGAQALKVLARAHQRVIWDRQRQVNRLRSILREFFPAALEALGTDLAHPDALALLARAPTLSAAAGLSTSTIGAPCARVVASGASPPEPASSKRRFAESVSTPRRRSPPPTGPRCAPPSR